MCFRIYPNDCVWVDLRPKGRRCNLISCLNMNKEVNPCMTWNTVLNTIRYNCYNFPNSCVCSRLHEWLTRQKEWKEKWLTTLAYKCFKLTTNLIQLSKVSSEDHDLLFLKSKREPSFQFQNNKQTNKIGLIIGFKIDLWDDSRRAILDFNILSAYQ